MSISEAGGISDEMTVEFTPGPVHPPAMTVVELRTIVAMPTADWVRCGHDEEKLRESAEQFVPFFLRGTPTITTDIVVYNVERRFIVTTEDRRPRFWDVTDTRDVTMSATGSVVGSFRSEAHARHYADRLEADPSLVDDA